MTALDLDAIKARIEHATLAPWTVEERPARPDLGMVVRNYEFFGPQFEIVTRDIEMGDAQFIAAARTDVPALVAEVEHLRQVIDKARGMWLGPDSLPNADRAVRAMHALLLSANPEPSGSPAVGSEL